MSKKQAHHQRIRPREGDTGSPVPDAFADYLHRAARRMADQLFTLFSVPQQLLTGTTTSVAHVPSTINIDDILAAMEHLKDTAPWTPDVIITTDAIYLKVQDLCHHNPDPCRGPFFGVRVIGYRDAAAAKEAAIFEASKGRRVLLVTEDSLPNTEVAAHGQDR